MKKYILYKVIMKRYNKKWNYMKIFENMHMNYGIHKLE